MTGALRQTASSWATDRHWHATFATVGKSLLLGTIAGLATFAYVAYAFTPDVVQRWWLLALLAGVGSANVWYVDDLRRGVATSLLSVAIAFAIHTAVWTSPVFLTDYQPVVVRLLLPAYVGQGLTSALLVLPLSYYGGYFVALLWFGTVGY